MTHLQDSVRSSEVVCAIYAQVQDEGGRADPEDNSGGQISHRPDCSGAPVLLLQAVDHRVKGGVLQDDAKIHGC